VQPLTLTPSTSYAGLGWRFLAVVIDSFAVGALFVVVLAVAAAAGALDLSSYQGQDPFSIDVPTWSFFALYLLLFVYYTAFELARGATPGKMALGMRVTAVDGGPPSAGAVVLRNLIRIPEAIFYYIPSAISCLASSRNQRLGDLAARTVVVRRSAAVTAASPQAAPPGAPLPPGPPLTQRYAPAGQTPLSHGGDPLDAALDELKVAALGLRGAHHNYLRLSEREIERGGGVTAAFSPEYAAAWHTLADAVIALQHANADAAHAAAMAGTTLQDASARRPDLLNLCRELEPYFSAGSDEQVHDAYLVVARRETPSR
jgi:uncharacterized RDD family membrane protein YckC